MLGNKVSPASLYTDSSIPNDSCGEESQQSQASLFGGSDVVSSLELFSQPVNSSQSQTIQSQSSEHTQRQMATGTSIQLTTSTVNHNPSQNQHQARNGPKYYMRYLSSVSLSKMKAGSSTANNETPLCSENRVGSTACSNASYGAWKSRQQEKFEKQLIIDEVVKATRDIVKELSDEIEGLRKELKTIVTEEKTHKSDQESLLTNQQTRGIFAQLLQGQAELKQQFLEIHRQLALEKTERELLCTRLSSLETTLVTTMVSTVEKQVQDYLTKSLETAVTNGLKKHTRVSTKSPITSNFNQNIHSVSLGSLPHEQAVPNRSNAVVSNTEHEGNDMFEDTTKNITNHSSAMLNLTQLKTCTAPETDVQSVPLFSNNGPVVLNSALFGDTSQGSVSTPCDIDLTQQSPSVCSQMFSQHLERSVSGSNNKKRLSIKNMDPAQSNTCTYITNVEKDLTCGTHKQMDNTKDQPTPRKVARKAKSSAKRGGRTSTKDRGGASNKSSGIKQRRSQRVRQKQTYTFIQDESSGTESLESVGSFGGSTGGICRRVTRSKVPGGGNIFNGTKELPSFLNSPMNALDDLFYSQSMSNTKCSSLVTTTPTTKGVAELPKSVATSEWKDQIQSQPTFNSHLHSTDKFHRSSEAAKRRKRVIAELSSSDPVFHEISESIRQQKMFKSEHSTLNREVL